MDAQHVRMIIICAVVTLLQIVIAPIVVIFGATPNIIIAFVVAYALVVSDEPHYVLAFVMGLVSDLLGSTPVGSTSLCLLVVVAVISISVQTLGNDNLVTSAIIIVVCMALLQLVMSVLMASTGAIAFGDAILYLFLPCTLYNAVICLLLFFLGQRFFPSAVKPHTASTPNLRFH